MKKYSRSIKRIGFTFLCLMLLSGCCMIGGPAQTPIKSRSFASTGKLLIMPPHDVIKDGVAHRAGKGSGKQLQNSIERELKLASTYEVVVYEANDRFNFTTNTKIEDAIAESKKIGADYCLILSLGEFRNAFPMTFLSDFVILDRGVLVDVNSGEEVWSLRKPLRLTKPNFGGHYVLIDAIAKRVVYSIIVKSSIE